MLTFGKNLIFFATLVILASLMHTPAATAADAKSSNEALHGIWAGSPKEGQTVFFVISGRSDGSLRASFGHIDPWNLLSGAWMQSVSLENRALKITSNGDWVTFDGTLEPDGKAIAGNIALSGRKTLPVTLTRSEKIPGPPRPQTPHGPFPYDQREVRYPNAEAGIELAGTLTVPRQGGPFPVVLLIHGSGGGDRNEEAMFHRPFDVYADYLTRRGIAVLRFDKRGVGESGGDWKASAGPKDFASDALAGLKYLSTLPEIDSRHMGLLGQSEGGQVAPLAAMQSKDVSFVVSLAGPAMNMFDLMVLQDGAQAIASGASEKEGELVRGWSARYYAIVRDTADLSVARTKMQELKDKRTPQEVEAFKYLGDSGSLDIDTALEPWFRAEVHNDASKNLTKVQCPILMLFGEKDCQVPGAANCKAAEEAFKTSGNTQAKTMNLPGMNHLFQKCTTGHWKEYGEIQETISPEVLKIIGDWIETQTRH